MSALTFKAVIAGVHFDPKKGIVKIQLEATSYVSMDKLITLGPPDESVQVTLESAQTRLADVGDSIGLSEEKVEGLKAAEEIIKRMEEDADHIDGEILTEFPIQGASKEDGEGKE